MKLGSLFHFLVILFSISISPSHSFLTKTFAQSEDPIDLVKMAAQTFISQEGRHFVVVSFKIRPHWHIYWKNPGDAGTPTTISFKQNTTKVNIPALEWPTPRNFVAEGDLKSIGYSDSVSIFYPLDAFEKVVKGKAFAIIGKWVACFNQCIPGMTSLHAKISDGHLEYLPSTPSTQELKLTPDELNLRLENLPQNVALPDFLDISLFSRPNETNALVLRFKLNGVDLDPSALNPNLDILTPFPLEPFTFNREKITKGTDTNGPVIGKIEIDWDGIYLGPPKFLPPNGKFDSPYKMRFLFANPITNKVEVIAKEFSSFSIGSVLTTDKDRNKDKAKAKDENKLSFFHYLLLAFLGGVILNLMPCVLPVISLKLFGLIKHRNAPHSAILQHNMFYSAGVLFTFILLALVIILLKTGSETVGWGFHLQSPTFVAIMVVILFIFSLNLFGLFEIKTPGGKHIGNWTVVDGMVGDFFSGILATILATPCSAPFLGPALAFAFASSTTIIFGIFLAVGFGLAFPFILTGFIPQLIFFLPRPGKWMKDFKHFLGITLIITTIWLVDIFLSLTQAPISAFKLNVALALIFFAFFFYRHISKRAFVVFAVSLAPLFLIFNLLNSEFSAEADYFEECRLGVTKSPITDWQKWTPDRLEEMKNLRHTVFIDFTAKWCLTCKVNKKMVLDTKEFEKLVKEHNLKLLRADWTKRDKLIGDWLIKHNIVGVPAYFIQKADGELIYLGETLSINKIRENL